MEKAELLLIEKYIHRDEELKRRVDEHQRLERVLEEFKERRYWTPEEQVAKKNLKKRKLREKEEILRILEKYQS